MKFIISSRHTEIRTRLDMMELSFIIMKICLHLISSHEIQLICLIMWWKQEIFQSDQSHQLLKPLCKKGYKCISNYRPISVLLVFSETFENIIYKWVTCFSNCDTILVNEQYDLRNNLTSDKATHEGMLKYWTS